MLIRTKLLSLLACSFWSASTSHGEVFSEAQYIQSGVIPLPARPPSEFKELVAVLEPYSRLNSRLVDAQLAGWLRLLNVEQLKAIRAAIPGGWSHPGPDIPMDICGLREVLPEAIASHPELTAASDDPLTAIEAGRRASKDREAAMETANAIGAPTARTQFILGLLQSADNAATYGEASEIRAKLIPLLPESERSNFTTYEQEKRALLWPVESIASWAMRQPEDKRFNPLRFVMDHGAHYFSNVDEATRFRAHLDRKDRSRTAIVDESMSPVLAARDPEIFLWWWKNASADMQRFAISKAIVPLLRRDATLIKAVIPRLEIKSLADMCGVTQTWFQYDPVAALEYCSKLPDFEKRANWWIGSARPLKPIEPSVWVDLMNRYPSVWNYPISLLHFDPRRHRPGAVAQEFLRIQDAKTRELALVWFGMNWGFQDGPAAAAWTRNIPKASDRKKWLLGLVSEWISKSPQDAAKALDGMVDLTDEDRKRLKTMADERLASLAHPQTPTAPSRFAELSSKKTIPPSRGGPTDSETLKKIRRSLAEWARPAEPPVSNLSLCVKVLSLGDDTVVALVRNFEVHPPVDAREDAALVVLLERWALSAPEPAARWMVEKGNGTTRQPLPLALARIALVNAELAATLSNQIPEDFLHFRATESIVYALATRDHREACEFGERHRIQFSTISKDWRRADRVAAETWLQARWLDRWQ